MQVTYETERLLLKIENERIFHQVLHFYTNNKLLFESYEPTRPKNFYTVSYQRSTLSYEYNEIMNRRMLRLWIYTKDNPDTIIGTLSFSNILTGAFSSTVMGYKLDERYWKLGYGLEACTKGIHIIFNDYRLHRIEARIMPTNISSLKLIARLGFQFEGTEYKSIEINHHWENHHRFSMLQSEWEVCY